MERPDWTPEGYRPAGRLTEEEHAVVRRALHLLLEGELVNYSLHYDYNFSSGGTAYGGRSVSVAVEGEAGARAEAIRLYAGYREDGKIRIRRCGAPAGCNDGFRVAGIHCAIDLRPGLVTVPPQEEWPEPGPWLEVDPVQPDLFAGV